MRKPSCLAGPALLVFGLFLTGAASADPRTVAWSDLTQATGVAGADIQLQGYLLPVDREDDLVYEFLLVPWPGACIHTTPPPPDQLVRVSPAEPYRLSEIYEPVVVSGRLKAADERQQVMMVDGVKLLDSAYGMSRAMVVHSDAPSPPPSPPQSAHGVNPWRKLMK